MTSTDGININTRSVNDYQTEGVSYNEPSSTPNVSFEGYYTNSQNNSLIPYPNTTNYSALFAQNQSIESIDIFSEIANDNSVLSTKEKIALAEEHAQLYTMMGNVEIASRLMLTLSDLYSKTNDEDGFHFSMSRHYMFEGIYDAAISEIGNISSKSPIYEYIEGMVSELENLRSAQEYTNKILPKIAALEQMRIRALDQLSFDLSKEVETWYSNDDVIASNRKYIEDLMKTVNVGIDAMVEAINSGRAKSLEEAFQMIPELTDLRLYEALFNRKHSSFLQEPYVLKIKNTYTTRDKLPKMTGEDFEHLLKMNRVNIDGLVAFSKLENSDDREKWMLSYVENLRTNFSSGLGYPAGTVMSNLEGLRNASNKEVRKRAEEIYKNASGKNAFTGMSDEYYSAFLRKGSDTLLPMVLAMLVAGPVGAYAEGTVASANLTLGGRILWSGTNAAAKAGCVAWGAGFGAEVLTFWAANDVFHATLVGGGEYFTRNGLISATMFLGGLKFLGKAWQATFGTALIKASSAAPAFDIPLKTVSTIGSTGVEWAGFVGIGKIQELVGLIPIEEKSLRQEIMEAGLFLLQLKLAVKAGNTLTGNLSQIKMIEIKLDTAKNALEQAMNTGRITHEAFARAQQHLMSLSSYLNELVPNIPEALENLFPSKYRLVQTPEGVTYWMSTDTDSNGMPSHVLMKNGSDSNVKGPNKTGGVKGPDLKTSKPGEVVPFLKPNGEELVVIMVGSESTDIAKAGGAADVTKELPEAWKRAGVKVIRIMPFHGTIDRSAHAIHDTGISVMGQSNGKNIPAKMYVVEGEVPTILLENPGMFSENGHGPMNIYDNPHTYGRNSEMPNGDKFKWAYFNTLIHPAIDAFISKYSKKVAASEGALPEINIDHVDAFVLNDWMVIPSAALYHANGWSESSRIGGAINHAILHNIGNGYRGDAGIEVLDSMNLPMEFRSAFEVGPDKDGNYWMSFLGGLTFIDSANTVSPTYAIETMNRQYSGPLAPILARLKFKGKYWGILNGTDYEKWNPENLSSIDLSTANLKPELRRNLKINTNKPYPSFSSKDISGKAACKAKFLSQHDIKYQPDNLPPVVSFISRFAHQKGPDVIAKHIPYMVEKGWKIVIHGEAGPGGEGYLNDFRKLQKLYPQNVILIEGYNDQIAMIVRASSDLELLPSRFEPCGLSDPQSLALGNMVIVTNTGGLSDKVHKAPDLHVLQQMDTEAFDKADITGFVIENLENPDSFRDAIDRADFVYGNLKLRNQAVRNAMRQRFDWTSSAQTYIQYLMKAVNSQTKTGTEPQ